MPQLHARYATGTGPHVNGVRFDYWRQSVDHCHSAEGHARSDKRLTSFLRQVFSMQFGYCPNKLDMTHARFRGFQRIR
jgi:hypothetical protein